ncbi:alpha-L RNA-binding motif-containing protein [Dichomitus squalens]|uniref:Alpha-L RNA-binding motif-containing protein n=2 Tax=Dichomitus squalens TaxID=114155 RepID=A0A4Q9MKR3_9APHY|nr:alpha-L RNA-binding motif-containing protein [Dichomitus squalens LYAD-421 SS1]EJF61583.1 alpha-L RNA-binding motif-containing protein [Dichomitus squalens LYAD-421 SS1]TBU28190.1 alpha-L RNA-binding motif-containing protein [Dichomitus squalens]TBU42000.1 alpha-L RNA-binding motif-containing protein [Dichomitus squalens]TBU57297.1 alpha-L RNA-binding motif-containing protein [Dichomitus squalens]
MRDAHIYNFKRGLPRMSWHPHNLYNLWRRSYGPLEKITNRVEYKESLNWRRWTAKALLRAYHGDFINEKIFKRWYLPETLPDVRPTEALKKVEPVLEVNRWANKQEAAQKMEKRAEEERQKGLAPVGSLMFTEVERRIDVVIFRACFAHSVYEARRLVIHGDVLLNGKKHTNPNTRLAPGDMVSVDPKAIRFLQDRPDPVEEDADTAEEAADAAGEASESKSESKTVPSTSRFSKKHSTSSSSNTGLTPFNLPPYASPFLFIPAYLEPSFATCSVIYLRHPTARPGYSEVPTPWDADGEVVRLTWEWYSKRRMRIRSKSQLARMPDNRQ